ncbi:hypothetical protein VVT58_03685 [Sphingobium sp. SJ10-10]|uniref:hypothetical protein n=1 Tax=Sphingobium sp. SJ10-10 TaxID=3114999 RepID=UPI002E17AEDF|nr:hypothetical protein [Sphingobium sp. SJ10-10]
MTQGKTLIIVLIALIVGFGAGIVLRPVIIPVGQTRAVAGPPLAAPAPPGARSTQYFAAHLDEGRRIVAGCAQGTVRGDECANAEQAVTEADGRDRFKRFLGK